MLSLILIFFAIHNGFAWSTSRFDTILLEGFRMIKDHAVDNDFRVLSSAVEHCPHTTGATGSNPVAPTIMITKGRL